jgi:hypothetical protein
MSTYRMHVVVPEDHRMTIEFPATIPSGPVELIVLVPAESEKRASAEAPPRGRGRLTTLAAELAQEAMPFRELTLEERDARLQRLKGAGRGSTSGSEQFAKQKLDEIERGAEVTKRLNDLFSDGELAREQARTANEWDEVGTDWSDECW